MAGIFTPASGATLASTSTPVVYSAESDVIAISVGFGSGRTEERVFRDGVFLPGYTRSFRNGLVYTIQRDEPWPAHPQIFVDERPPDPPPVTSLWTPLYTRDLRTLPSRSITPYVDFTMDGVTWWAHCNAGDAAIVNGQGATMKGNQDPTGGNNYAGTYLGLRLYDFPGYVPTTQQIAFQCRFAAPTDINWMMGIRQYAGGVSYGSPATAATTLRRASNTMAFWSSNFSLNYSRIVQAPGGGAVYPTAFGGVFDPWMVAANGAWRTMLFSPGTTNLSTLEDMQVFGSTNDLGTGESAAFRAGGFVGNTAGGLLYMTHVRVLVRPFVWS